MVYLAGSHGDGSADGYQVKRAEPMPLRAIVHALLSRRQVAAELIARRDALTRSSAEPGQLAAAASRVRQKLLRMVVKFSHLPPILPLPRRLP